MIAARNPLMYDSEKGLFYAFNPGADRRRWIMEKFFAEFTRGLHGRGFSTRWHDSDEIEQCAAPFRMCHWRNKANEYWLSCLRCGFYFEFTITDVKSFVDHRCTVICLKCRKPIIRDGLLCEAIE